MAGKIDRGVNNGTALPIFKLGGQNYYNIGSLLPPDSLRPTFAQLYIYDTENEIDNRIGTLRSNEAINERDRKIVAILRNMLDKYNSLAKSFRYARDRYVGYPSYFITMICNPEWDEIKREVTSIGLKAEDRPDILCRVFKIKLDGLINDLKEGKIFGKILGYVCTVEFQKRGLPHAHILLFMSNEFKPQTPDDIDKHITAEIPDENERPNLHGAVQNYMVHGLCGPYNKNSPCMKNGSCSKFYPKEFKQRTLIDEARFSKYRRTDNGRTVKKRECVLDNKFIVPYNPELLLKFGCHINVEYTCQTSSIKYLFKYVHKGNDRVTATLYNAGDPSEATQVVDEIRNYYDCRYISACEAVWRLFGYEIQEKEPFVIRLPFHLEDEQHVVYGEASNVNDIVERAISHKSMFLGWMATNMSYPYARSLTYAEFPTKFVWKDDSSKWFPRKKGFAIGRLTHVPADYPPMPLATEVDNSLLTERVIREELNFNRDDLKKNTSDMLAIATLEQRYAFDKIVTAVYCDEGGFFFVYGHGGTGKTFLWNLMSAEIRLRGDIVLNVASSGIASLLLTNGRMAHSRFKIPLNITEDSVCNIKLGSSQAMLLLKAKLIIWDEAPMVSRYCYEALDKCLGDIMRCSPTYRKDLLFGGKVVVLGGDFRKILPVIPRGSRQDIVHSTVNSSYLWKFCQVLKLTKNMRLSVGTTASDQDETEQFGEWLLKVGDGLIGDNMDGESEICLPGDIVIPSSDHAFDELVYFSYPNILENMSSKDFFKARTVMAPTLDIVEEVNNHLMAIIPGGEKLYLSSDSICMDEGNMESQLDLYGPELLNSINCSGLPPHKLILKVGVPVMLLRNIDQSSGL
ncbi:uncharacterized protein [Arachis hypogaea]|uniref:uncharacterized protein n=1 Tax=Arachis hypogaea TaxID=3818 RepID=UPI003B2119EB